MGTYRQSRNLEKSIRDYIKTYLTNSAPDWTDLDVIKTFAQIKNDKLTPPIICVRCGVEDHAKIQLGNNSTLRTTQILIDIFGSSDGNKADIKDWLIEILKDGCSYNEYVITNGIVDSQTETGRIRVINIEDTPINLDDNKNNLDTIDRYRQLLTIEISTGKVEA